MNIRMLGLSASLLVLGSANAFAETNFNRIASFEITANIAEGGDKSIETAPEIIAATADGMMLVYTDSEAEKLGFIDITDPKKPQAGGALELPGEPTSVSVIGQTAFVAINTSESYIEPSGTLLTVDVVNQAITAECALNGQPDAIAAAPDGSFIAIAIENERDEDLNDGVIPQLPPGNVTILAVIDEGINCDGKTVASLTGLADVAPEDPEPEFVDINSNGEIVVTLQENNHIAVLSRDGDVISHFSAGTATLNGIDVDEERALTFNAKQEDVPREPDAVQWIDNDHFATADEGDYEGGTRGWTIYSKDGTIVYDDALAFERALIEIGHYPEKRSGNKGVEPESVEAGTFNGENYVFVGSERGSIVGVYKMDGTTPTLSQLLPSGVAPEGILAIPSRNLLVTANEKDLIEDKGPRAHVMIYALQNEPASYPTITAKGADELFGWTALSGMVGDPDAAGILYAVNDSFLRSQPRIFRIDANEQPARITGYVDVTRDGQPAQKLDLEGITTDGEGGFWIASEGRTNRLTPHALYKVNAEGAIEEEISFPSELLSVEKRFGAEGITRAGSTLWIAIQREWKDDPKGFVKLVSYNIETDEWGAVHYPLESPAENGWVGLSEITAYDGHFYILERDNKLGSEATVKRLYRVSLDGLEAAALGGELPVVEKTLVRDLLPDLQGWNGYVQDKVEGFAIDAEGVGFVITDNDGVDDHSGETFFWSIGKL